MIGVQVFSFVRKGSYGMLRENGKPGRWIKGQSKREDCKLITPGYSNLGCKNGMPRSGLEKSFVVEILTVGIYGQRM